MVLVSIRPAAGCLKIDLDVVFCEQCRVSVSLNQVAQSRQRAEEARHGSNAKHQVNCENTRNCMKDNSKLPQRQTSCHSIHSALPLEWEGH